MNSEKIVSLGLVVLSVLYLVFAGSIEERTIGNLAMTGPGSRTVPLVLGWALLALSVSLVIGAYRGHDRASAAVEDRTSSPSVVGGTSDGRTAEAADGAAAGAGARASRPDLGLVVTTIVLGILYVVLLRPIGFVPTTSVLLFVLVVRARLPLGARIRYGPLAVGAVLSTGVTVGVFLLSRWLMRWAARYGRTAGVALLSNRFLLVIAALLATGIFVFALLLFVRRFRRRARLADFGVAMVASLSTTQVLYLVFRQIFQVNLPPGLLPR